MQKIEKDGYCLYPQPNGPTLGASSAPILERDGKLFKNLARTGELLPYEDWRLSPEERAADLAARLSIEQIAGLMLYSPHQSVPGVRGFLGPAPTYGGKEYAESGAKMWQMTDQQKQFLAEDHVRHVLLAGVDEPEAAARWSNEMQKYVEALPFGIPCNNSSDPRHAATDSGTEFRTVSQVSKWPEGIGMAAMFDPDRARAYGEIVSREYRAMGITTALGPQVDLSTEPRWMRLEDTFGEHPAMAAQLAATIVDAMQTTQGSETGWGRDSVLAMAKHWPGGGPLEGGRDAHYRFGCYAVYPGGGFEAHLTPFTEGAMKLPGGTKCVSAIMPYYSVTTAPEADNAEKVGNAYNRRLITELLRGKYGFDGVVCTDWGVLGEPNQEPDMFAGQCFGAESLTEAERYLRVLQNGVDQFGGCSDKTPVLAAYELGCARIGKDEMDGIFRTAARRLLQSMFRVGLFENPYLDPAESRDFVGCAENQAQGFAAQLASMVLLKNEKQTLPLAAGTKVYIPKRHVLPRKHFVRVIMTEEQTVDPIADWQLDGRLTRAATPEEADVCVVFVESPLNSGGYRKERREETGSGYEPISLQYRPYTAATAREKSLQGDDYELGGPERGYRGVTVTCPNESDLDNVIAAKRSGKPVVVVIRMHNPAVLAELEPYADAILVEYGVERRAVTALLTGEAEPSGLLPHQLPRDMQTVEAHCEDRPFDLIPYTDAAGHTYDFAYGMNWQGVITDERTKKWKK